MSRESASGSGSMVAIMRESARESTGVMGAVMSALWQTSAVGEGEADATGWEIETTWKRAAGVRTAGVGTTGSRVVFGWGSEDGCGGHGGDEEGEQGREMHFDYWVLGFC